MIPHPKPCFWHDWLFPQQSLYLLMQAGQLLGDRMLRPVLLLCQALYPPSLGEELADLFCYVLAVLISHKSTIQKSPPYPKGFRVVSEALSTQVKAESRFMIYEIQQ